MQTSVTSGMVVTPVLLTLRYFCAYSAHCLCGGYTWGVAPGFILLRLQRALVAGASSPHPKFPQIFQRASREKKRSTFGLLKTAPSSLKTAPGNVEVGLRDCGDTCSSHGEALYSRTFCLFPFSPISFSSRDGTPNRGHYGG